MATYFDESGKEMPRDEIIKILSEQAKQTLEFNRYKQDCRKRALEMAHGEFLAGMLPNAKISVAPAFKVGALADKYYKWLISIPNE